MQIQHFFDPKTWTLSYLVWDEATKVAVLIDPLVDYDTKAIRVSDESAEKMAAFLDERGLKLPYVLDTHVHADHLTGMSFFKERYGAKTVISKDVDIIQRTFAPLFGYGDEFPTDGRQFDLLVGDGDSIDAGPFQIEVIGTPGHTPASVAYKIQDAVFVGDLLFQPDSGTARCDFPGGSAGDEYDSIQKLYALPDETRIFTGHDYQPGGREIGYVATVAEHKQSNIHLRDGVSKDDFIALRKELEAGKELPNLIFQALQINLRAGALPPAETNGTSYLKLPLNQF